MLTNQQAPPSDKIVSSPVALPDLEINGNLPSPDSFVGATHDTEFLHLKENIRRLRKAPQGPEPRKVDAVWEVYKKLREESLQLCKSLLHKSRKIGANSVIASMIANLLTTQKTMVEMHPSNLPILVLWTLDHHIVARLPKPLCRSMSMINGWGLFTNTKEFRKECLRI